MPTSYRPTYSSHQILRTSIYVFGKLFNNFYHAGINSTAQTIDKLHRVPLLYLPRARMLKQQITANDDNSNDPQNVKLNTFLESYPRMSYEFTGLTYDSSRQLPASQRFNNKNSDQSGKIPAPYDLQFELLIVARDQFKALEIIEQILPYFKPVLTVSVKHQAFDNVEHDVAVTLNSVEFEDDYDESNRRHVVYTLQFTLQTDFWPAVAGADWEIKDYLNPGDDSGLGPDDINPIANKPIKKIIIDYIDCYDTDSTDPFWPVLWRETDRIDPLAANNESEVTGYVTESLDASVLTEALDRKPPN